MKKDYKIFKTLYLLSNNSRISSKEIGKEIKTSQQNASYIISKLEKDNKILFFKLLVDSSKFGFNNFCVFLRLKNYSKITLNKFLINLKEYKEITSIDFLFGSFDVFLRFTTPNASNFNKIFREILNNNHDKILEYDILTQIVLHNYPLNYLSKKKFQKKNIISGDRHYLEIDTIDKKIINYLNENSRINYSKIANFLDVTSKTIIMRIKILERKNILKGYSIVLNHKKLNINRYYLLLKLDFHNPEIEKKFNQFTQIQSNIVELIKVFGIWDHILIIETLTVDDFKKLLFSIKEFFSEIIINYTFYESEEVKIWKYLPELENIT